MMALDTERCYLTVTRWGERGRKLSLMEVSEYRMAAQRPIHHQLQYIIWGQTMLANCPHERHHKQNIAFSEFPTEKRGTNGWWWVKRTRTRKCETPRAGYRSRELGGSRHRPANFTIHRSLSRSPARWSWWILRRKRTERNDMDRFQTGTIHREERRGITLDQCVIWQWRAVNCLRRTPLSRNQAIWPPQSRFMGHNTASSNTRGARAPVRRNEGRQPSWQTWTPCLPTRRERTRGSENYVVVRFTRVHDFW